jgi:hypothetical protein
LITDSPPPEEKDLVGLPRFRRVVATLAARFYDRQKTVRALERGYFDLPAPLDLPTRVDSALAWISHYGRDHTWIQPGTPQLREADISKIDADRIARMDVTELRTRAEYRLFYLMLFGVAGGPPVRRVLAYFGKDRVHDALQAHRRSGSRPLRDMILDRLNPSDGALWTSR